MKYLRLFALIAACAIVCLPWFLLFVLTGLLSALIEQYLRIRRAVK